MDRSSRQKINKETQALPDPLEQVDLIDIHRIFHPKAEEYTFFSSDMEHSLGYITFCATNQALFNLRKLK